jgi:hypothetical protein
MAVGASDRTEAINQPRYGHRRGLAIGDGTAAAEWPAAQLQPEELETEHAPAAAQAATERGSAARMRDRPLPPASTNPATPVRKSVLTWSGALEQRVLELQHAAVLALIALAEPVEIELRSRATQGLSEGPCS